MNCIIQIMFWELTTILCVLLVTIAMFSRIFIINKVWLHSHGSLICVCIHAFTSRKIGYKSRYFFLNILLIFIYFLEELFWKSSCVHRNWAAVSGKVTFLCCSVLYHFEIWVVWGVQIHDVLWAYTVELKCRFQDAYVSRCLYSGILKSATIDLLIQV